MLLMRDKVRAFWMIKIVRIDERARELASRAALVEMLLSRFLVSIRQDAVAPLAPISNQESSTHALTLLLYARRFSLYSAAASEFAGEFGFGSHSSDCMARQNRPDVVNRTPLIL